MPSGLFLPPFDALADPGVVARLIHLGIAPLGLITKDGRIWVTVSLRLNSSARPR